MRTILQRHDWVKETPREELLQEMHEIEGRAEGLRNVRSFESGATRDVDHDKHDPEGFLSPMVIDRFNQYMHKNRVQKDGTLRDSDNWQKGIPTSVYIKSLWRHFLDVWLHIRGNDLHARESLEDALCGIMFNAMGILHETLTKKSRNPYPELT